MAVIDLIEDGCTESTYFKAAPGLYPEVRYWRRPMTVTERNALLRRVSARISAGQDASNIVADELAARVQDWDLQDRSGNLIDITPANLLRLPPELFDRMYSVLRGQDGGDIDPLKKDEPDVGPLEKTEEAREKN